MMMVMMMMMMMMKTGEDDDDVTPGSWGRNIKVGDRQRGNL